MVSANVGMRVPLNFASNHVPASSGRISSSVKSSIIHRRGVFCALGGGGGSDGKHLLDVGRTFERVVVQADDLAILRQLQIDLDVVGALLRREINAGTVLSGA